MTNNQQADQQARRLGLLLILLRHVGDADVVEAIEALGRQRRRGLEPLDGRVVIAAPAERDAFVEGLSQLRGLGVVVRRGARREHDVGFADPAEPDGEHGFRRADRRVRRADLVIA